MPHDDSRPLRSYSPSLQSAARAIFGDPPRRRDEDDQDRYWSSDPVIREARAARRKA